MNTLLSKIAKQWIPLAFIICCFCGLAYLTVQQAYRQSANDPQIQIAEDSAAILSSNASTSSILPTGTVNIAESLAPFIVIYDNAGNPIAGNGILDNALPSLPAGVFDSVRILGGEDRFTWQPRPGIRSAVVVVKVNGGQGGFVMAGRSLREVEIREDHLTLQVGAVFLFSLIGSFLLVAAGALLSNK